MDMYDCRIEAFGLSKRELEVLQLLVDGMSPTEAALALHISVHTCRTHIKHIFLKSGSHSLLEAASNGVRSGLRPRTPLRRSMLM